MIYSCPDPTPDQIALATQLGKDPYDRCGNGFADTSATDIMCAACLIHDELYMLGGSKAQWLKANKNFRRDTLILAHAVDDFWERTEAIVEAVSYADIVDTVSWHWWHKFDRNNDVTRVQGRAFMDDAARYINAQALKIRFPGVPYPEAVTQSWIPPCPSI